MIVLFIFLTPLQFNVLFSEIHTLIKS